MRQSSETGEHERPRLGIALGSGSARGWAHIGVLQALAEMGIEPDVVAGTSIGALVGGAYVTGQLGALERWARSIRKLDIVRLMDVTPTRGGFIAGSKLFDAFRGVAKDAKIESLGLSYGAVATDFETGREIWLTRGSLFDAVRASLSLPGLFIPVRLNHRWLVDGGLVNPVPVSVCRALGADLVIAVNLSGDLTSRNSFLRGTKPAPRDEARSLEEALARLPPRLRSRLEGPASFLFAARGRDRTRPPGFFDVLAGSINIMQDRVTRSRMAGDPPDVVVAPRLAHIRMLDYDQAAEAISEGRACVEAARSALERLPSAS